MLMTTTEIRMTRKRRKEDSFSERKNTRHADILHPSWISVAKSRSVFTALSELNKSQHTVFL